MEHEIYVPFSATVVRAALADPERIARCVPGFQSEPGESSAILGGRLRVRIGGSTITYRGTLEMGARGEGVTVDGQGDEARGNGSARVRLEVVPRPVEDGSGTTLVFTGAVEGTGRIAEFASRQRQSTARRLLDRFTEALVAELAAEEPAALGRPDDDEPAIPGIPAPDSGGDDAPTGSAEGPGDSAAPPSGASPEPGEAEPQGGTRRSEADAADETPADEPTGATSGTEGVSPSLGNADRADAGEPALPQGEDEPEPLDVFPPADTPEADLARRTMIGRSAEEVDHAPPRGRYAPQPAAGSTLDARATLRWAAPAAALAVAGAVAVTRILRRRR